MKMGCAGPAGSGEANLPPCAPSRRTVDAFTRALHALLALSFVGAYSTRESELFGWMHVTLGYTMGGLLLMRLAWGLAGPRHARLSALLGKLRGLRTWSRGVGKLQVVCMAFSVVVLLLVIAPVVVTGYVAKHELTGEWMAAVHEFFGNFLLLAFLAHVGAVIVFSLLRRRNLAVPMLTGRVAGPGPDLIRCNHVFFAVLLLGSVLSFWVWQWQHAW